jgi:hypothetical protein
MEPQPEPAAQELEPVATIETEPERVAAMEPEPEPAASMEAESPYAPIPTPEYEPEPEPMFEAEPEPVMEMPAHEEAPPGITIREFFATLGSARPPAVNGENTFTAVESSEPHEEARSPYAESPPQEGDYPYADDAFASLFENAPVNPEDSRAAAALSSAVAHTPPPIQTPSEQRPSTGAPEKAADQTMQESEDDIRRFREWLDGLANS